MRKREKASQAWNNICDNCEKEVEFFAGLFSAVWKKTMPYVETCDEDCDKFSIATLSKDKEAIQQLYDTINLDDSIKEELNKMLMNNSELLLTLNPFILQDKYSFLKPILNELALDTIIQDKLLSLDDFELSILKNIVELSFEYGVNSNNLISLIIDCIGRSSIPGRNNEQALDKIDGFFKMIKELEKEQILSDEIIGNIGYIIKTGIFPSNKEELKDFNKSIRERLFNNLNESDNLDDIKDDLLYVLFGMNLIDANFFVKEYDLDGIPNELLLEPGVIELMAIRMIINEENINKLKEILTFLLNDKEFSINLFSNCLLKENVLKVFAKEFNKCRPNFSESNLITAIDDIKFYDSGTNFYSIVKTLGAFSDDGEGLTNYYDEWNDKRYRCHVNAVSLVRNDNLAFAENDGKYHIKLGFYNFGENIFLGGGNKDINSAPDSRSLGVQIYSILSFPSKFIDTTREWHNELDYERKDVDSKSIEFKKNPDFIILDQECEDMSQLRVEQQKQFEEYKNNTIRAAKEFGNLPILVINREKIAKNELELINIMLGKYEITHEFNLLKSIIIKFNNNRNGCRGPQHTFIRENYFSNSYFQELLNKIDSIIVDEQRELLYNFVQEEKNKMEECSYDKTTRDLPIKPSNKTQRGGLNV